MSASSNTDAKHSELCKADGGEQRGSVKMHSAENRMLLRLIRENITPVGASSEIVSENR